MTRSPLEAGRHTPTLTRAPGLAALAAAAVALLGACADIETPVAEVTGRIVGASAGAQVYPLGRPDLVVSPGVADGEYRIGAVPVSVRALILFDGADRAELVPLALGGGERRRIGDRYGAAAAVDDELRMPLAGTAVAVAHPEGGALPHDLRFEAEGTTHRALPADAGTADVATLYPLPGGTFRLAASLPGFRTAVEEVSVVAGGTVALRLDLEVDLASSAPGCAAGGCLNDLACNPEDGRCQACTPEDGCDLGESCDVAGGLCVPDAGLATGVCMGCTVDGDCASGVCVVDQGEPGGYCSVPCAAGCPAGFACDDGAARCVVPSGCDEWLQTMGSTCVEDADCDDLAGGICAGTGAEAGRCTAPCTVDLDCQVRSTSSWSCAGGLCLPP